MKSPCGSGMHQSPVNFTMNFSPPVPGLAVPKRSCRKGRGSGDSRDKAFSAGFRNDSHPPARASRRSCYKGFFPTCSKGKTRNCNSCLDTQGRGDALCRSTSQD